MCISDTSGTCLHLYVYMCACIWQGSDFAIKISEADSIMLLGDSRDAGYCKSVTKAGNKCQSIVNR